MAWHRPTHLRVSEAAELLRTTSDALYRRIRRGSLPAIRDGRTLLVPVAAIEDILGSIDPRGGATARTAPPCFTESRGLREESRMEKQRWTPREQRIAKYTIHRCTKGQAKWEISLFLSDGRRLRRRSPHQHKADTERWAQALLRALEDETNEPAQLESVSVAEACERWLATQQRDRRNKQRYLGWVVAVRVSLSPAAGGWVVAVRVSRSPASGSGMAAATSVAAGDSPMRKTALSGSSGPSAARAVAAAVSIST